MFNTEIDSGAEFGIFAGIVQKLTDRNSDACCKISRARPCEGSGLEMKQGYAMATVLIQGEGIAAFCCLRLLRQAGLRVAVDAMRCPKLPAVMLSETTQRLLRDVFDREDLFAGFPQVRRRVVAWGRNDEPRVLPHSAIVVSEKELLDRIQQGLGAGEEMKFEQPDWTVFASSPLPPSSVEHHFGSRLAAASAVKLQRVGDQEGVLDRIPRKRVALSPPRR